jgi:multicomponent Na+:H+ antiporter subunit A
MSASDLSPAVILLLVALLAAPVTALVGAIDPREAGRAAIVTSALAFAAALWGWADGGDRIDLNWAPTWNLRLAFQLDGLAVLYSLLATGIGLAVILYSSRYIPLHLAHEERPATDAPRFYAFILLFMGSMVGLVMARDLLLIFVFWDLTAIASYFLIGYDRHKMESRRSALMALLVTVISAFCLLIGAVMLFGAYDTFLLDRLVVEREPGRLLTTAAALMAVAALAKSAQVPFHFWLPRAMAAPTPVSAYLHSAAMVAAGVFLLGRLYPLIAPNRALLDALLVIGFLSMAIGGVLSLTRETLKQILAYSTISQYGYVVVLLGLGGEHGAVAASFYVVAHALAKSALFLTAGAVTEATGETSLAAIGGLWRRMPWLAAGSAMASAGLAALPLTVGFFKDELYFATVRERGGIVPVLAVAGAILTFAYIARFWTGIFLGPNGAQPHRIPRLLTAPVVALGGLILFFGVWPYPVGQLAESAAAATIWAPTQAHLSYHLEASAENLMALAAYAGGIGVLLSRRWWLPAAVALAKGGEQFGPERLYRLTLVGLNSASDRMHRFEVHDLRGRVASILLPAGALVIAALVASVTTDIFTVGTISRSNFPLLLMIGVASLAAITATFPTDHLTIALVLSGVGFSLAVVYSFFGAPDVALVAVLIETVFAILFLGMLVLIPNDVDSREVQRSDVTGIPPERPSLRWRDPAVAITAGAIAFVVAWSALSKPVPLESITAQQIKLAPTAHGKDIVTVILADIRGFDTMGEITVVAIAFLGVSTLLRRWRVR